jgi:hypothetical protein
MPAVRTRRECQRDGQVGWTEPGESDVCDGDMKPVPCGAVNAQLEGNEQRIRSGREHRVTEVDDTEVNAMSWPQQNVLATCTESTEDVLRKEVPREFSDLVHDGLRARTSLNVGDFE